MAKQNIFKSKAFTSVLKFQAVCKKNDFSGEWRLTKKEAILDALEHQGSNKSHKVEILVENMQQFTLTIGRDEIKNALK